MSNGELAEPGAYDNIQDIPAFIKQMGRSVALSKMCGVETEAQGEVLVFECLGRRCRIMSFGERYNFMHNRLTMKAETMLADFITKVGGEHEIIERTSEAAEISLSRKGKPTQRFRLTWEEAQKEPFVYEGKEKDVLAQLAAGRKPAIKAKYQTPRSRMQMLWSRVVSDGVHCMAPEVTSGAYTAEEVEDFDEVQGESNGASKPRRPTRESSQATGSTPTATPSVTPTVQQNTATEVKQDGKPETSPEPEYCTGDQSTRITQLLSQINPTEAEIDGMKKRRNVSTWRQLTVAQADELIGKLQQLIAQREASTAASAASTASAPQTSAKNTDPATETQVAEARKLIGEIEQSSPKFTERIAAKIKESGLGKLVDLNQSEIEALIRDLRVKNLEAFFAASLEGHAKFRPTQQASIVDSSHPSTAAA